MRAQISLDFMLAISVALVAMGTVVVVGTGITEMQKQSSVRQQLGSIGIGLSAVISESAVLDDADNATISYNIPKIAVLGESKLQACKIVRLGSDLNLSYDLVVDINAGIGKTVWMLVPFTNPAGMQLNPVLTEQDPAKCGQTIAITKS